MFIHDSDSSVSSLKKGMKKASITELKFVRDLIDEELRNR